MGVAVVSVSCRAARLTEVHIVAKETVWYNISRLTQRLFHRFS